MAETGFLLEDLSSGDVPAFLKPAALCRQVHESAILTVAEEGIYGPCDGLVTRIPGLTLMVRVADCTAVALWGDEGPAMILHAGWRGAAAGILEKGLEIMAREGIEAAKLSVHLFPSARACCYEVMEDIFTLLPESMAPFIERRRGKSYLDIPGYLKSILVSRGCFRITVDPRCTICSPGLFSYRRDKTHKRHGAWIRLGGEG
ncbi:polyphenol oxidase family protein [Candidatus Mcinerneyibacteriota bacterium]|nr:polyphenol oxidase family protein [Candidatus Mcinerneyibacteriota bacterium]